MRVYTIIKPGDRTDVVGTTSRSVNSQSPYGTGDIDPTATRTRFTALAAVNVVVDRQAKASHPCRCRSWAILAPLVILLTIIPARLTHATDSLREKQIAAEMGNKSGADATTILEARGNQFSALYRAATVRNRKGGVILFGGVDHSPETSDTIQALRKRLPDQGWDSLSLQSPVREQGASLADYRSMTAESVDRLTSAVSFFKDKSLGPVALVGYQFGCLAVLRYLANSPDGIVSAAVLVDIPGNTEEQAAILADLAKIKVPLLDTVRGRSQTLSDDLILARKRAMTNNPHSRQLIFADSSSGLEDVREMLVNRIHGWLSQEIAGGKTSGEKVPPP